MYDSSSVSTLFSSLSSGKSGSSDLLGINYSDYASIRSGSYGKLMRSYFSMNSDSTKSTSTSKTNTDLSTSTAKDSAKTLAAIESDAEDLTDSAKALYQRSNNKVFTKDASGNYSADKIYSAVNDFVSDYNSMIESGGNSSTKRIAQTVSGMKSETASNESALKELGITVDSKTGKLSIDETTFKSADMDKAKKLFYGTGSYAYSTATKAAMAQSYAKTEASKSNTYAKSGNYNYNYNSGSIFSDFF